MQHCVRAADAVALVPPVGDLARNQLERGQGITRLGDYWAQKWEKYHDLHAWAQSRAQLRCHGVRC